MAHDGAGEALAVLEGLRDAVEAMPGEIDARLSGVSALARQIGTAAGTMEKAAASAHDAAQATGDTAYRLFWWLVSGAAVGLMFGVLTVSVMVWSLGHASGYRQGRAEGHEAGLQENRDAEAAASWANTPAGQLAWRMETTAPGVLAILAQCAQPGWKIEDKGKGKPRMCWPHRSSQDGQYGWQVP